MIWPTYYDESVRYAFNDISMVYILTYRVAGEFLKTLFVVSSVEITEELGTKDQSSGPTRTFANGELNPILLIHSLICR